MGMRDRANAREYCFKNSWRLRRDRKRVSGMIDYSVNYLQHGHNGKGQGSGQWALKDHLRQHTKDKYPGNPVVVWILLNVMLPIVIKLVMRWWEKRNQKE